MAIEEFYEEMTQIGYYYNDLPLVLPLIFFPSIEILVAAFIDDKHNFDNKYRLLKPKPDLKQSVWLTPSIPEALETGTLHEVLEHHIKPDVLGKVYKNLTEVRKFVQLLSFCH